MTQQVLTSVLVTGLLTLGGCNNPERERHHPLLLQNTTEKVYERSVGKCDHPDSVCAQVTLRYLEFGGSLSAVVRDSLTSAMRATAFAPVEGCGGGGTPEAVAEGFLGSFESMRSDLPEMAVRWSLERSATVEADTLGIGTIAFEEGSYSGGAHPNSFLNYQVFDLVNGRRLSLVDIVKPGKLDELNAVAEEEFRDLLQLGKTDNLDSAGFWFPNHRFSVNSNFCVSTSGLVILFNPYEIAPYAAGPIELDIPYERLRTILDFGHTR
jgi:hypothetical protein